jgi:hypothetical protein
MTAGEKHFSNDYTWVWVIISGLSGVFQGISNCYKYVLLLLIRIVKLTIF